MITFRFSGRTPTPNTYQIGQESDQNAERLRFLLPQIADNQSAKLYMTLPDGTPEIVSITNGIATVSAAMTEQPGLITAYVGILAGDNIAWNSELIYMDVGDLPPITEEVARKYPTAIQNAMDAADRAAAYYGSADALAERLQQVQDAFSLIEHMELDGTNIPAGGTAGQYLRKRSSTNYDAEWAAVLNPVLKVDCGTVTSLPVTITNSGIRAEMALLRAEFGNRSAQTGDWTVTPANGSVTISGTISGSTTLVLYMASEQGALFGSQGSSGGSGSGTGGQSGLDQETISALSAFFTQFANLIPQLAYTNSGHNGAATASAASAVISALGGSGSGSGSGTGGGTGESSYSITKALTNCTISNAATSAAANSSYSATLSVSGGYTLGSVTVTMGGTDITSTAYSNGTISIPSVTGNVVITATAAQITYTVTNSLTNCTNSNSAASAAHGGSYSATIAAGSGYTLQSVAVTMGGTDITATAYNSGTGAIYISSVTGNLVITASAASSGISLSSISAALNLNGNTLYEYQTLNDVKQYLTVTATYSDSSTATVSAGNYTLSGNFEIGTNTVTVTYSGKTATVSVPVSSALPQEYTRLDCVATTGAQYINTGVLNADAYRAVYEVMITANATKNGGNHILSCANTYFTFLKSSNSSFLQDKIGLKFRGRESVDTGSTNFSWELNRRYKLEGNASVKIDGAEKATMTAGLDTGGTLFLFTYPGTGTSPSASDMQYSFNGRLYNCSIFGENGNLLRYFIPAKNGSSVVGLYDPISTTFYTSGSGTALTEVAAAAALSSISATFNQGGNTVYESASLDDLKQYLTVTATYSDSSTETVSASSYTLSGTLAAGTSTITVSYGGKTDTFTVTVTAAQSDLSSISAALNLNGAIIRTSNSLNDLKQYLTVTAAYSNSTTAAVSANDYTLSGSLALDSGSYDASTKTVTVSYGGKTATVQVKVYNAMTAAKATLPSGYTQLAMVTSAGSTACYVDTGIASSAVDHVEYGVQAVSGIGNGTNWHVLSSADTWYPYFRQGSSGARNFQGKNRNSGSSATSIDTTWEADTNYVIQAYPDVKINGTTAATIASSNASDSANLFVFARNSSGSPQNAGKVRMYYIKMYDGQDQLIHNFVPCKNSSNVAGLYDTVGAAFYSSAGGTALTAGEAL